jgi:hypothetical protein
VTPHFHSVFVTPSGQVLDCQGELERLATAQDGVQVRATPLLGGVSSQPDR